MAGNKTATFNMRIDPDIKKAAEKLFAEYGLDMSDAINIFLYQALYEQEFPFELKRRKSQRENMEHSRN